ncbi:recombinase family protein [Piscinibacterium candidicorallinum]|uniref:Recombinase family protein n=1 Tax=Piscinibacterium candidicorallinum TaxID=1793872 RepID=A0ABV7H611_9BURK
MNASTARRIGYRRVSTVDQSTARQLEGLALDSIYEDKASGSDTNRPQLQALRNPKSAILRPGDTLVVHSMDRLARNLKDLRTIVEELTDRGVRVEFVRDSMTFEPGRDARSMLLLQLLGAVAEFERSMIRERQQEGIEQAKARGVYKGRKPSLTPERVQDLKARDAAAGGKGRTALAREFGISRETLYQYLKAAA